jgi:hypothetical protein
MDKRIAEVMGQQTHLSRYDAYLRRVLAKVFQPARHRLFRGFYTVKLDCRWKLNYSRK